MSPPQKKIIPGCKCGNVVPFGLDPFHCTATVLIPNPTSAPALRGADRSGAADPDQRAWAMEGPHPTIQVSSGPCLRSQPLPLPPSRPSPGARHPSPPQGSPHEVLSPAGTCAPRCLTPRGAKASNPCAPYLRFLGNPHWSQGRLKPKLEPEGKESHMDCSVAP